MVGGKRLRWERIEEKNDFMREHGENHEYSFEYIKLLLPVGHTAR